jgi:hypothetical protein
MTVPATVTKASETFRESVAANFELEADFLNTITELFVKAAAPLAAEAKKSAASRTQSVAGSEAAKAEPKARAPRKKSAYNVYVREQMKTADIQGVDHKQKMGAIAGRWNALSEEEKKIYADMANGENVAAEVPPSA